MACDDVGRSEDEAATFDGITLLRYGPNFTFLSAIIFLLDYFESWNLVLMYYQLTCII